MAKPYDEDVVEYQFNASPETPGAPEAGKSASRSGKAEATAPEKKPVVGSSKRKLFWLIVVVLVAFGGYKAVGWMRASGTKPAAHQPVVVSPAKVTPVVTPAALPDFSQFAKAKDITEIMDQLNQLKAVSTAQVKSLEAYKGVDQKDIQALQMSVGQVKANLDRLQTGLQTLSSQLKQRDLKAKAQVVRQKKAARAYAKHVAEQERLFVEAVIPGRAWLRGVDGSTRSVVVGDMLKGYGRVVSVDAYSGVVRTASGLSIEYGVNP